MAMKTPGVYIVEKNAFPNSVVEVATAVPAFIGHTQVAHHDGHDLTGKPWRISSMAEYERDFGGPPRPRFSLHLIDTGCHAKAAVSSSNSPTTALAAKMQLALAQATLKAAPSGPDMVQARGQQVQIKRNGKTYLLSRQSGQAGQRFLMHQAMRHFFQNGGGPCYVVSVGDYGTDISAGDDSQGLIGGLAPLLKQKEPTLVLVPDAVLLSRADCMAVQRAVLKHCGQEMRNRMAILDVWGGDLDRKHPAGNCIDEFRNDIGTHFLGFASAYYPWLHTSLHAPGDFDCPVFDNPDHLQAMIWDELGLAQAGPLDKNLLAMSELYTELRDQALGLLNLMPPAAAMAGLYTMVDNTRGVWKAPANVSVAGVTQAAVEISHADQEDLNVSAQGKSINAIRSFIGEGALVWGARTLDGNSLDWRYINVRRTMIMLEESCRLAAKAMVFEPNVGNTWVTLKSMISNFLTGIWKRGGLAGAVPDDAFSVHVGLGETMTPEDILEGILRVTVLVAISRPAEFIEITFQQQMQKS